MSKRVLAAMCATWLMSSGVAMAQETALAGAPQDVVLLDSASALIESARPTALELKEALRQLKAALEINPQSPGVYYELARYHAIRGYISDDESRPGALDEALAALREAMRVDPHFAEAYVYAGYLHAHAGRFDEARAAFKQAHALGSQSEWLPVNEAELEVLAGDQAAAQRQLSEFLAQAHRAPHPSRDAYRLLVRSYAKSGDREQVDRTYAAQAAAYRTDAGVRSNYALLLATEFGDFDAAIAKAREALELDAKGDGRRVLALGLYAKWADLRRTDPGAAKTALQEAAAVAPLFAVGADRALSAPKLATLKQAIDESGVVDEQGKPKLFRYVTWTLLQAMGLAELGWQPWLILGVGLLLLGLTLERAQSRRRAGRPVPPAPITEGTPVALQFTGSGGEYFRIWVVNLLLTILTLGIYSAWAKVRRLKYFYRNTELAGERFDYHGEPGAILKGRIIAIALLLAYKNAFVWSASLGYATLALLAVLVPWLIRSSMRFRLRNSSYRGIRFGFNGSAGGAYYVFLIGSIATLATLYLLAPFFHQRLKRYQHDNSRYGQLQSSFDASVAAYYGVYARFLGILLGSAVAVGVLVAIAVPVLKAAGPAAVPLVIGVSVIAYLVAFAMIAPYLNSRLQNLVWNHSRLGPHRFESRLKARSLCWIYVSNFVLVLVTAGLFMPWAAVRLARYKLASLSLIAAGPLDDVAAQPGTADGAAGQEATEFFDIDISL